MLKSVANVTIRTVAHLVPCMLLPNMVPCCTGNDGRGGDDDDDVFWVVECAV